MMAAGFAQMMRVNLYQTVHVKTLESQKKRVLLRARKLLQEKAIAIENDIRGLLVTYQVAKDAARLVGQNFAIAIGYNVVAVAFVSNRGRQCAARCSWLYNAVYRGSCAS